MAAYTPMLWLAVAMVAAAAVTLGLLGHVQRPVPGTAWWQGALWLNAATLALLATLAEGSAAAPWIALGLAGWPVLVLIGVRRFHARLGFPGDARRDALCVAAVMAAGLLALSATDDLAAAAWAPRSAATAVLLYASLTVWRAGPAPGAPALRGLPLLWVTLAVLIWLSPLPDVGQARPIWLAACTALASLAMAFIVMTMCSLRTERALRQSHRRLRVLANIDMLTQVPNRRRFEELARRTLQADPPGSAALLLVDIDHFKQINDHLGHAAGDRALKLVSRCTLDVLRANDVAGRHGGDEFVLLLRHSSTRAAMQVADRLVRHLQARSNAHALPPLTLSFGIVQLRAGETVAQTLHRADLALYEAKRQGRCRAVAADGDDERPVFHSSERLGLTPT